MSEKAGEIYYDIEADVSGLLKAQGKANKSLDSIGNSATNAAKKMDELQTNINRVAGAIAASLVVDWGKAFLVAADNMSQLNARIERLTGSAATASQTMQNLMRISSATGGSLQDTAKLWETLSTALRDTGATNGQIIQLTETLQKIGRIGGSSSEEMANALRQFGQSISSGTVRAEEFNSILEQMPELARQIAAGMGVSIGELRQLMLDGNPTLRYPATARSDTKYGFTAAIPNIQLNIWNGDTVQLPSRYLIATVEELDSQLWTVNSIKPNTDNTVSLTVAEYSDAIYQ